MDIGFDTRRWLRWLAGFIGFPLAGLAARAVAGPIDSAAAAAVGGAAAGATLGLVQAVALGGSRTDAARRVVATSGGMAVGLLAGAAAVDYSTSTSDLVMMGAITGLGIGVAQAVVLGSEPTRRVAWLVATPLLWALGWWVTAQVISNADDQFANFGASGALLVAGLGGAVLSVRSGATTSVGSAVAS